MVSDENRVGESSAVHQLRGFWGRPDMCGRTWREPAHPANQTGEHYSGLAILISSTSRWVWLSIAVALGMMTR